MKLDYDLNVLLGKSISELDNSDLFNTFFGGLTISEIDPNYYLTNEEKGLALVMDRDLISNTIQIFSGDKDGMAQFEGNLPFNCSFNDSIDSVHAKVGVPVFQSGGGVMLPILGKMKPWRKYEFDNCFVHFEFKEDRGINMISIEIKS